ncbi:MAG: 4-hydroxythreonine-4-phosphate dehydrogenase PdxA [Cytophagales bacterium]|nr:4-hydroxythreonine-4-phosphate dehydrogenase PdxA [Cytophagales bacterium]
MTEKKTVIGITIGDYNGVSLEILLQAFGQQTMLKYMTPVVYASEKLLTKYLKNNNIEEQIFHYTHHIQGIKPEALNVVNCWNEDYELHLGTPTAESGKCAVISLNRAVADLKEGKTDALCTLPIDKHNVKNNEFNFIGHTEYLQHKFQAKDVLMFMVSDEVRIAVVSMHVPVNKIDNDITEHQIKSKLDLMLASLKIDFNITKPKIAVIGLNPHAGDSGEIGTQDRDILTPIITAYKNNGHIVMGPFASDGFFGSGQYTKYDAVLCMYHDQGLIPFKMISFETGVNFTAGLPVVRTSPDHGTAFDIAGKNMVSSSSFQCALFTACDIVKNRAENKYYETHALKPTHHKGE